MATPLNPVSRVRIWAPLWSPLLLLLLLLHSAVTTTSLAPIPYSDYCGSTVPESTPTFAATRPDVEFVFLSAFFSGADEILGNGSSRSVVFRHRSLIGTETPGTLKVQAFLLFNGDALRSSPGRRHLLRFVFGRGPRLPSRRAWMTFDLAGFWSEGSGKLCLVGYGRGMSVEGKRIKTSAVLKMDYPKMSNISNAFGAGTLLSLGRVNFSPISMLASGLRNYEYSLVPEAEKMSAELEVREETLALAGDRGKDIKICALLTTFLSSEGLKLQYGADCQFKRCSPVDGGMSSLPSFVYLNDVQCPDLRKVHLFLTFSNLTSHNALNSFVDPGLTLLAEGIWDSERNHLALVACRVINLNESLLNASVGDCTIGFSLWFPKYLTLRQRNLVSGRIWSKRSTDDSGYFGTITVHDTGNIIGAPQGLKYKFTEAASLKEFCSESNFGKSNLMSFPGMDSFADLRLSLHVETDNGGIGWGSANPISIGETLYDKILKGSGANNSSPVMAEMNSSLWNVSYKIVFHYPGTFVSSQELHDISAEGIYNLKTGALCMIGCRPLVTTEREKYLKKMPVVDCSVLIRIQFSSLHSRESGQIHGTIRSTRQKSDPLYFKPVEIYSYGTLYKAQARDMLWRIHLEIVFVLISLTSSCVFAGLQLFHVKRHPDVLPSISLTMLVILALGHMIPLVMNIEAFSPKKHDEQGVTLQIGSWLEVGEVTARLIAMIAVFLQFRLVQLARSARLAVEHSEAMWTAEKKSLQLCLPMYLTCIFISWFIHSTSHESPMKRTGLGGAVHDSRWGDLSSYVGLVLDGFLLPQAMLNVLSNSKDKALLPVFYFGNSVIRAMPHLYDIYRTHNYAASFDFSYVYARPGWDLFSIAWDIMIPFGEVLFAVVICMQQKFGGACILPPKFRKQGGYEAVPIAGR